MTEPLVFSYWTWRKKVAVVACTLLSLLLGIGFIIDVAVPGPKSTPGIRIMFAVMAVICGILAILKPLVALTIERYARIEVTSERIQTFTNAKEAKQDHLLSDIARLSYTKHGGRIAFVDETEIVFDDTLDRYPHLVQLVEERTGRKFVPEGEVPVPIEATA